MYIYTRGKVQCKQLWILQITYENSHCAAHSNPSRFWYWINSTSTWTQYTGYEGTHNNSFVHFLDQNEKRLVLYLIFLPKFLISFILVSRNDVPKIEKRISGTFEIVEHAMVPITIENKNYLSNANNTIYPYETIASQHK